MLAWGEVSEEHFYRVEQTFLRKLFRVENRIKEGRGRVRSNRGKEDPPSAADLKRHSNGNT
jgi:hypothetical protein